MKKIIIAIILFFPLILAAESTYYVNGATGSDIKGEKGNSPKNPLHSIQKAVDLAGPGDKIIVEGKYDKNGIVYYEGVTIPANKYKMKIIGENNPTIDGSNKKLCDSVLNAVSDKELAESIIDSLKRIHKNGFFVKCSYMTIKGFTIRFFRDKYDVKKVDTGYQIIEDTLNAGRNHSAGIRTAIGTVYHEFDDNEISECNWGIFLDGTIYSQVNNCRIVNMKKYKDKDDESGIGIMIYPSSIGLEANQIGFKKGNYVYNCDKYGLCIGVEGMEKFIDNTKIQNNTFEANNEFGVAIRDLKGIGDFSKNVFKNNNASLLILGFPMDLWIGDNKFEESAGKTEIETSNKYDGAYLYDLWTANGNKFAKSFAAVNKNREIVAVGDKRYIRSIEPMAREDAGSDNKVESKP